MANGYTSMTSALGPALKRKLMTIEMPPTAFLSAFSRAGNAVPLRSAYGQQLADKRSFSA
jgi:hypothetical protein